MFGMYSIVIIMLSMIALFDSNSLRCPPHLL